RVSCKEYHQQSQRVNRESGSAKRHLLLDVRDEVQFAICQLPEAVNIPIDQFETRRDELERLIREMDGAPVYAVCRRGNVSQMAVQFIREKLGYEQCFDIAGGLIAWQREVDAEFPAY
ncbi:hypothetical protein LPJ56_006940, partial [Coemansia sp. RSA 2599]